MAKKREKPQPTVTAAIYTRYSSTAQNDASIEQQIAECEQYAQANKLTIVARYEDRAISGRSDKRPGFQKCLRAADRHEFQVLLAYKSNRISRNMQSALNYEQRLANAGVRVVYCKEEFGDNATGRFMLRMMMNMNQFYSENMSEDIRRGMVDSVTKGKVVGSVPYGYKKGADGRYEIDEPAAAVVREIFARYMKDEPLADIRRDFNERGLLTRQKKPWAKNSFHAILVNEKYTGSYTFGDVRVEDAIPAIIDKGVFAMAQKKLDGEKIVRKRHRGNEDYMLTGKLFCGYCYAPMVGMSGRSHVGREHFYYACQTRRTKHTCDKKNVRKEAIEMKVVQVVQGSILDDKTVVWIADSMMDASRRFKEQTQLSQYESHLREVKKQINNLVHAIEMGVAGDEVKERMDDLQEEKRTYEGLIAIEKVAVKDYDRKTIIGYVESIRQGDPSDKDFQKMVIRDFVKAVYVYDDHLRIVVDFTGENNTVEVPFDATDCSASEGADGFAQGLSRCTITFLCKPRPEEQDLFQWDEVCHLLEDWNDTGIKKTEGIALKRITLLMLVIIMVFPYSVVALGFEKTDVPLMIAVNYVKWAEDGFGVSDLRKDFDGEVVDSENEYSSVDDLIILDNPSAEKIQYVKLYYFNRGKNESQQNLRAMAMFAAIEYGAPGEWYDPDTLNSMTVAMNFYKALEEAMKEQSDMLTNGKTVPFYVSNRFTYMLSANVTDGIVITVV